MPKTITLNNKDLLIVNLVHYFVTEKNYNPIILHGIEDEIWLENIESDYRVIRIVGRYIHNDEQLNFDKFKLKQIIKKLKVKTLSLKLNTLTIYTDLGENVNLANDKNYTSIFVKSLADIKNPLLLEVFPNIIEKTSYDEKGLDLFVKITEEMNQDSYKKSVKISKIFESKNPVMTYSIIIICTIVFLMMYLFGNGPQDVYTLLKFGANYDVLTKNGDYYRLLTSMFIHLDTLHLLLNMYSLYVIGPQVESFFGKSKFLAIYLISGISGSLLSLALNHNVISAGASGAIFGLLGSILYFGYHYRVYLGNAIKSQILPVIAINLLFGFLASGIDNFAHIGGLIGGVLITMAVGVPEKSTKFDKGNGIIATLAFLAFLIYLGFFH